LLLVLGFLWVNRFCVEAVVLYSAQGLREPALIEGNQFTLYWRPLMQLAVALL
jgi:hypothetical protein